jgi:hypothetical protein
MSYESYIARKKDYNFFLLRSESYIFQYNLAQYSRFHELLLPLFDSSSAWSLLEI